MLHGFKDVVCALGFPTPASEFLVSHNSNHFTITHSDHFIPCVDPPGHR